MGPIAAETIDIDPTVEISKSCTIKAKKITIERNCVINEGVEIRVAGTLKIGYATVIKNSKIICQNIFIGNNNYIVGAWIEGSMSSNNSNVTIGDENLILQNTRINCNDKVIIGNDVGIGQYVEIWTHGTFLDILQGYPYNVGRVTIGSHVWLTAHSVVMPGVKIGNNIIIGNNTLVNKDVPDGCFFAGQPGKVIKSNIYPPQIPEPEKEGIIDKIIMDYLILRANKSFECKISRTGTNIFFSLSNGVQTIFNISNRTIDGDINKFSEDFRDYLRFRGVKFFTDRPFSTIIPQEYEKVL